MLTVGRTVPGTVWGTGLLQGDHKVLTHMQPNYCP